MLYGGKVKKACKMLVAWHKNRSGFLLVGYLVAFYCAPDVNKFWNIRVVTWSTWQTPFLWGLYTYISTSQKQGICISTSRDCKNRKYVSEHVWKMKHTYFYLFHTLHLSLPLCLPFIHSFSLSPFLPLFLSIPSCFFISLPSSLYLIFHFEYLLEICI